MPTMSHATTDPLGLPVTLADASSAGAVVDFVEGFLRYEARIVRILDAAADPSVYVQTCCAALHMFSESAQGPRNAQPFIARALASPLPCSAREVVLARSVAAWVAGDMAQAVALLQTLLREHPRDLVALKLAQYHLFNQGDSPAMLRLALGSLQAGADVAQLHGMLAFAWEQCHLLEQAERAARRALAMRPREPWAQHALAHVMLTQGRLHEGLDFMRAASAGWVGLNSFMHTHNWWHLALFALELDRPDEVLHLYDTQVWGIAPEYSQDQIGAVSLLARLELAGVPVGPRWAALALYLRQRTADHVLPFLDLQYLYGLARAGLPEADALHAHIAAHANALQAQGQPQAALWCAVCVPASAGLLAHARGDWAAAVRGLGQALPRMLEIGGSHAQRDLFDQIYLDALMRGGQHNAALHLLQPRANAAAQSLRLQRQVQQLQAALGLAGSASAA